MSKQATCGTSAAPAAASNQRNLVGKVIGREGDDPLELIDEELSVIRSGA